MLIKKITIENVRSFLDRREMSFDGPISIIIGPNGGGKTNLLDVVNTMLRRYLFATRYFIGGRYSRGSRVNHLKVLNEGLLSGFRTGVRTVPKVQQVRPRKQQPLWHQRPVTPQSGLSRRLASHSWP